MPRKQKKYHYIYKTTCQITGKFYVGMHSTDNLDDGYLGSGKILGYSIGKHGRENHKKEILEFLPDRVTLKVREAEVVNEELLTDPLCINLKYGGEGGWDHISPKTRRRNALSNSGFKNRDRMSEEARFKCDNGTLFRNDDYLRWVDREAMEASLARSRKVALQPENLAKRKATFDKIKHQSGSSNSQFGTKWVSKDGVVKKIKVDELNQYLTDGWKAGRK